MLWLSGDEDKDVDEVAERVEEIKIKEEDKKAPESPSVKKKKDPLNWFGVLVPQALKTSQKHFKQVRLKCITLAIYWAKLILTLLRNNLEVFT